MHEVVSRSITVVPDGAKGRLKRLVQAALLASGIGTPLFAVSSKADPNSEPRTGEDFGEILDSEETILALTPSLRRLGTDVLNLQLPHLAGAALFAERVTFSDLAESQPGSLVDLPTVAVQSQEWSVSHEEQSAPAADLTLWRPLLDRVEYFEHAKFYFERGNFLDPQHERWEADLAFSGAARTPAGHLMSVEARVSTHWRRQTYHAEESPGRTDSSAVAWKIERWQLKSLTTYEARQALFSEVLDQALADAEDRRQARQSIQEELVIEWGRDLLEGKGSFEPPHALFDISSLYQKPGLSVVDIDRDGFDDLYVMPTWGNNLLLHNKGDGTFEEIAAQVGLDLKDNCSSAIFADFDNDGDADAFIGRTLRPSLFFVNENGRFVNRSDTFPPTALPYLVTSISAADFDQDGLLDVYFSTHASDGRQERLREVLKLLPAAQAREMLRRREGGHRFHDHSGPPNVLLVNRVQGRFDIAAQNDLLALWRNTFQSTWSDYDDDGDPDLYVANDFAPNNMLRNDGGTFTDVTEQTRTADIGFGMGASWGDYDLDGRKDLYVCNMFSKAGHRIMAQIPQLDPRISMLAGGNSLFHNRGADFEKVSGTEPPSLLVEKSGWAWGGQFVDLDNDGFLDIYSLAGYYSAPEEIAIPEADL